MAADEDEKLIINELGREIKMRIELNELMI